MLSYAVYENGQPAPRVDLSGAYIVGSDDVPLRAEITFQDGIIQCKKRAAGPAGLAIPWAIEGAGTLLIETVRVPERENPYLLQVELARARLMRIHHKLEDWGLLDFTGIEDVATMFREAQETLISALQAETPAEAAALGDRSLAQAVEVSDRISHFHSEALLARRKLIGAWGPHVFGCAVPAEQPTEALRERLASAFDFVTLPIVWRDIESSEQNFDWTYLDRWVELLSKRGVPLKGSSLLSFHEQTVPDWLYIWEHDFDTIRDLAFEHVRRVINRYGQHIQTWDVISGIHANNCFTFNFEQLMELTRMTAALTKQAAPQSTAIVDMVAPWGEYYARNQRTIPPMLYADMTVQSGVSFDAFGLQFHFGPALDGMYVRDMFQISSLLDQFAKLGKPLHITAVQVPSSPTPNGGDTNDAALGGGVWRKPWSEPLQSEWLKRFVEVALSKPFIESVSWPSLADHETQVVPSGGLLRADLTPKPAFDEFARIRQDVLGAARTASRGPSA